MAEFPAITHVALTVSDLDRSVPWYGALFGTAPVLDEDTGPFRHVSGSSVKPWWGSISFPIQQATNRSTSVGSVWITWRLRAPADRSWRSGRHD